MVRFKTISLLALGLSSAALPALAADIVEEPVYVEPAPLPVASGWYLRGDVGYVFESESSGDYGFFNPDPLALGIDEIVHYDEFKTESTASFGAGVGYRFTDHVRGDVTVDYFKADLRGSSECAYLVEVGYFLNPVDNDCRYDDTSKVSVWTTMANAYIDIAKYGRFTPYVGAGLGFSHVKYDRQRNEIVCGSSGSCPAENYVGYHEGESTWRFASSLMAGASIDLTERLKLDAGYRYTRIAEGDAYGYDEQDRAGGASGVQGRDHGFDIHAIRAGLRYEFGGAALGYDEPAPVYAEPEPAIYPEPIYK